VAEQGPKPLAYGTSGMVSTSHPLLTATALPVLQEAGNAIDALLTAMLVQHVVEPQMSTPPGGFGVLYWDVATRAAISLNANIDRASHAGTATDSVSYTSGVRIGVPGTVPGMRALADRFGTRTWENYFEPAINFADEGFAMYSFLYGEMAAAYDRISRPGRISTRRTASSCPSSRRSVSPGLPMHWRA
jgi:gamma-glutamyltranspeptidase/glutathione hydrolase